MILDFILTVIGIAFAFLFLLILTPPTSKYEQYKKKIRDKR